MVQGSSASNVKDRGDFRECHLASILPTSEYDDETDTRTPIDFRVCLEASAYLALEHLNDPSRALVDTLSQELADCDIRFTMELRDSRFSTIDAARQLYQAIPNKPFAVLGAARSSVTSTVATLATPYQLPQISPSSTASLLDDKGRAPFFARTVPTNAGDAQAYCIYLKTLGVTNFGIYFINDDFGTSYHTDLASNCQKMGLRPVSVSYAEADIASSLSVLAASQVRYIVGIFNPNTWRQVMTEALELGIAGPGYTWLLSEASLELTSPSFSTIPELAAAVQGVGVLTVDIPQSAKLSNALDDLFNNETEYNNFVELHVDREPFQNYTGPNACGGSSVYPLLAYDAVLSLGVAACQATNRFFTGIELYQQLLETEIEGISGQVSFDPSTGTRSTNDLSYRLENIVIDPSTLSGGRTGYISQKSAQIDLTEQRVTIVEPFVYADNTTTSPPSLPELEQDMNLIPSGIRALGISFGGIVMALSATFLIWTFRNRNLGVVRASQPVFLAQICVGTFVMASAVIPLSMQEPTSERGLNVSCMVFPWLLSIGFVTAFSALFSKTWRLNKLFHTGYLMRRTEIRPLDVMLPFIILMTINIAVLIAWTVVDPLVWTRQDSESKDIFGRPTESYGFCGFGETEKGDSGGFEAAYLFLSLVIVVNFISVVIALYQCYVARNIPSEFSESFYIAISVAMIFEISLVAVPILMLTLDSPTASFVTRSFLIMFVALMILLPIFLPKYLQQRIRTVVDPNGARARQAIGTRFNVMNNILSIGSSNSEFHSSTRVMGATRVNRTSDYFDERRMSEVQTNCSVRDRSSHIRVDTKSHTDDSDPTSNPSRGPRTNE